MSSQQTEGEYNIQSTEVSSSSDPYQHPIETDTSPNFVGFRLRCRRPIRRPSHSAEHADISHNNHVGNYHVLEDQQEPLHVLCNNCRNRRPPIDPPYENPEIFEYHRNVGEEVAYVPQGFQDEGDIVEHLDENINFQEINEPLIEYPGLLPNRMGLLQNPYEPRVNPFNLYEPVIDFHQHFNLNHEPVVVNPPNPIPYMFMDTESKTTNSESVSTRYATLSVIVIFATSILALYLVYQTFPKVTEEESKHIKVPWNIEDAKQLGIVLNRYKGDNYYHVMAGVFLTYIFLQTFAIPGSLFLSILSGFLFPFYMALILVCTCSMLGATLCFMLSQLLGRRLVLKHFPKRASKWALQVEKHKDNLFNYMVFLRITPILPNWFINLTAPVIGVPLIPFAFGTFIGVAPPSFFAIQGGQTLLAMTAKDNAFNMQTLGWLGVFALVSIIPIFLKNKV